MALFKNFRHNFLLGALLLSPLAFSAPSNYRAVYSLEVRGISAGTVAHESFFTDITYRIDAVANPSAAASILGFGEAHETAKGLIQNNKVQPQLYQRSMNGKTDYSLHYRYEPKSRQVIVKKGNKPEKTFNYDSNQNPMDTLSMVVQSLIDIELGKKPSEYTLIMEDNMRSYHINRQQDEKWTDKSGKSFTVQVYKQSHGDRATTIYIAQNPLRLMRLVQTKKGEKRFSMTLTKYQKL